MAATSLDLEAIEVGKLYAGQPAMTDMSFTVERSSIFLILGPSGCGNASLMLVGSELPLTVMMYGRMREGATPLLNAVSLLLMVASAALALTLLRKAEAGEAVEALQPL